MTEESKGEHYARKGIAANDVTRRMRCNNTHTVNLYALERYEASSVMRLLRARCLVVRRVRLCGTGLPHVLHVPYHVSPEPRFDPQTHVFIELRRRTCGTCGPAA